MRSVCIVCIISMKVKCKLIFKYVTSLFIKFSGIGIMENLSVGRFLISDSMVTLNSFVEKILLFILYVMYKSVIPIHEKLIKIHLN